MLKIGRLVVLIFTTVYIHVEMSIALYAQDCIALHGKIMTRSGEVLPGANIRLRHSPERGTSSDAEGNFKLFPYQRDSIIVSFVGFEEKKILPNPNECFLTIILSTVNTRINEVTVTAERLIAEEFTVRKIQQLQIYQNASGKADPLLSVNSTPFATPVDESANISLRGSHPAETGIFFNHVPVSDAVRYSQINGIGTFSIFNTALIQSVSVYPGNPPLEYGNSTSGLIALQTNETIPLKNHVSVSLSLANISMNTSIKITPTSSLTVFSNYQPSAWIKKINSDAL